MGLKPRFLSSTLFKGSLKGFYKGLGPATQEPRSSGCSLKI